ncbi:MAG: hypothetical protein COB09_18480 [Thalassobium sp.]|nr:MAG: hypothetical protein COB09_18480 [Thalassobium sp.]
MGTILIYIVIVIVAVAVAQAAVAASPNASLKPLGEGEFKFPTADAGRAIPYIAGTVLHESPNVIERGALVTVPFYIEDQLAGYHYGLSIGVTFCYGSDVRMLSFISDNYLVFADADHIGYMTPEQISTHFIPHRPFLNEYFNLRNPDLYGFRAGGPDLVFRFNRGHPDSLLDNGEDWNNASMQNVSGRANVYEPTRFWALRNVSWASIYGMWGTNGSVRQLKFELERLPNPFAGVGGDPYFSINDGAYTDGDSRARYDANPAFVLYELLTSPLFGAAIPAASIDDISFLTIGVVLFNANFGISIQLHEKATMNNIKDEILKHINGIIETDRDTGKLSLRLLRDDWELDDLKNNTTGDSTGVETDPSFVRTSFTDDLIKTVNQLAQTSADTVNTEFKVAYIDRRRNYTPQIAVAFNNAAMQSIGNINSLEMPYKMLLNETVAQKVAWREMRMLASAPKPMEVTLTRAAFDIKKGDVIVINWSPLGLVDFVARVKTVNYGDANSEVIVANVVEDAFREDSSIFDSDILGNAGDPDIGYPDGDSTVITGDIIIDVLGGDDGDFLGFSSYGGSGVKQAPLFGTCNTPAFNGSDVRKVQIDHKATATKSLTIIIDLVNLGTVGEPIYYERNYIRSVEIGGTTWVNNITDSFVQDIENLKATWHISTPADAVLDGLGTLVFGTTTGVTIQIDPAVVVGGPPDSSIVFIEVPRFMARDDKVHVLPLFETPNMATPKYVFTTGDGGVEGIKRHFPTKHVTTQVIDAKSEVPLNGSWLVFGNTQVTCTRKEPGVDEFGVPIGVLYDDDFSAPPVNGAITLSTKPGSINPSFDQTYRGLDTYNLCVIANADASQYEFIWIREITDYEEGNSDVTFDFYRTVFGSKMYSWPIGSNIWMIDLSHISTLPLNGTTYVDENDEVQVSPVNRIGLLGASDFGGISTSDPIYQDFTSNDIGLRPLNQFDFAVSIRNMPEYVSQSFKELTANLADVDVVDANRYIHTQEILPITWAGRRRVIDQQAFPASGEMNIYGRGNSNKPTIGSDFIEVKYYNNDTSALLGIGATDAENTHYFYSKSLYGSDQGRFIRRGVVWRAANPGVDVDTLDESNALALGTYIPGEGQDITMLFDGTQDANGDTNHDTDNTKTADLFAPGDNFVLRLEVRGYDVKTGYYSTETWIAYMRVDIPI